MALAVLLGCPFSHADEPPERCQGYSDKLKTFALMINAFWISGNPKDSENPSFLEDMYIYSFRPVDIPVLNPTFSYYLEYQRPGIEYLQTIFEVVETNDGRVHMVFSNFADLSKFVPGTFELEDLAALQDGDLIRNTCTISYEQRRKKFVEVGRTPNCLNYNVYYSIVACKTQTFRELNSNKLVRQYLRFRQRYPLTPYMQEQLGDFNFPCKN